MENWKKEALSLAKTSILEEFQMADLSRYYPQNKELLEKWACFVTLKRKNPIKKTWDLRWCIWSIIAYRELYKDIIENAKNAAFKDPRFLPLTFEETKDLIVEISVLTEPEEKNFENIQDLILFLEKNKPGLIIKLFWRQATFLPSVWEEIENAEQFLIHLIYKAWLSPEEFVQNFSQAEIFIYSSIEFKDFWENIEIID